VSTQTEQRVLPAADGASVVLTQHEIGKEKERVTKTKREMERIYTSFMLRLLGESRGLSGGTTTFSEDDRMYLIEALAGMSANYRILLEDSRTTQEELDYYLDFAREFGLNDAGVTTQTLSALLPFTVDSTGRNYGLVIADYRVRYNEESLAKLLEVSFDDEAEEMVRTVMRELLACSYIASRHVTLPQIGWAYWSDQAHRDWKREGMNFTNRTARAFAVGRSPFRGIAAPTAVTLERTQLLVLDTLMRIEEHMVKGLRMLYKELSSPAGASPAKLEKAAAKIGDALRSFDAFDELDNTVFAIFDRLIALVDTTNARTSSLELTSEVKLAGQTRKVQKVFTTGMDAEVA
jgi:hypothetical protein